MTINLLPWSAYNILVFFLKKIEFRYKLNLNSIGINHLQLYQE
jgi:hypothetical protein